MFYFRSIRPREKHVNMVIKYNICVASLQKGPHVAKIKIEIFVDLNRPGHDKSLEKKIAF